MDSYEQSLQLVVSFVPLQQPCVFALPTIDAVVLADDVPVLRHDVVALVCT